MANYYGKTRTNYFKVTDAEALCELSNIVCGDEDSVHLGIENAPGEEKRYMLWCEGTILGIPDGDDEEDCDYNYDEFVRRLQKILPDGEAVIITEVGSEKMRYLVGEVVVITNEGVCKNNLNAIGKKIAREMLNNPHWETKNWY